MVYNKQSFKFVAKYIFLAIGFEINWIFCWSPVLHSYKRIKVIRNVAEIIDNLVLDIFYFNGKIYKFFFRLMIDCVVLLFNAFILWLYIKCVKWFLPEDIKYDFLVILCILFVYRYVISQIIAFLGFNLNVVLSEHFSTFVMRCKEYFYRLIKNNTYLLLLIFFMAIKYTALEVDAQFGLSFVEAIGALFLIDTYVDNFITDFRDEYIG